MLSPILEGWEDGTSNKDGKEEERCHIKTKLIYINSLPKKKKNSNCKVAKKTKMLVNVGVGFNDDVRVLRQHLIRVGVDETIKTTIYCHVCLFF